MTINVVPKITRIHLLILLGSEVRNRSHGMISRRLQGLLEALGENLFSSFFQLLEAAHSPWLTAPSSISKPGHGWRKPLSNPITLPLLPPCSPFKDPCDYILLTQIMQNKLLILQTVNSTLLYNICIGPRV